MKKLLESLKKLRSKKGATAVEYALMVSLIAVAIMGAVYLLGDHVRATFQHVADVLPPG